MAVTSSVGLPLGNKAPDFKLRDVISGKIYSLEDFKQDKALVVMFICNHCPFVKHVRTEIVRIADEFQPKGIGFTAISSNDVTTHPDDGPDQMKLIAEQNRFSFPYLYDEFQDVAKAYQTACTPEFFVFDRDRKCVYHGQLDDSRPGNDIPVTGKDLRQALHHLLAGESIPFPQKPSIGCSIKWKK